MGQYNSMSPLFKEFGFPILEQLLKKAEKNEEYPEVIEIKEDHEKIVIEVKDETSKDK